ncbi:head GIN domain-containing protein [Lutibacter sp.]|uniref:head GIN domain-containing protein n=1 Tax=Lutibacter sp. TaxID=1925666 RepID=UPI0027340551|nr:head GIN domain-containing protein [Lutibacter sp.]MDP3313883.1 head GIN domain-containing protein [Lutibacter sp.]
MKKLVLILLFVSTIVVAQQPVSTNLGDFNTLKVYNGLTVEIKKGTESKIEITGPRADDISIKNSDGILKVRLKFPDNFEMDGTTIVLYYSKNIEVLDANEGAKIVSENKLKQPLLDVKVQEGAIIKLDIDVKHLTIKTVSGGIIDLKGIAENQNIEANTGGIYNGFDVESKQAIVNSLAGSVVEIDVSEVLDAKAQFGGSIFYKGKPSIVKSKSVVKGVIKSVN